MPVPTSIQRSLEAFEDTWSPRVIARVDDHEVKLVKMLGEFVWHSHPETDEMFIVQRGLLRIDFEDHGVDLGPGDLVVIPRGVRHRPVAAQPCEAVLVERVGTVNTGDADPSPLTATDQVLVIPRSSRPGPSRGGADGTP